MNQNRERDYRLDFCRGIALIVIFVDHVPGNPLSAWTLRNFSFCDAAEIFVLISGMSSYLAYGSRLSKAGFVACLKAAARNCLRIYLAHIFLIGLIAVMFVWISARFTGANYIDALKLNWMVQDPWSAIGATLTLSYLPRLMDILPMYVVMMAAAPILILIIQRDYRIALAISLAVYAIAWKFGWNLPADRTGREWYFNPFAWQLLYTIGLVLCHLSRTAPDKVPWRRSWLLTSIVFLLVTFAITVPLSELWMTPIAPFSYVWPAEKTYLAPIRIINVLALLYVFAYYVSPQAAWLKKGVAAMCISCGRHSLPIYGTGLVLSCLGYVITQESAAKDFANFAVNAAGIAILFATALVLDKREGFRLPSAPAATMQRPGRAAA
jgi:hypothetical protein